MTSAILKEKIFKMSFLLFLKSSVFALIEQRPFLAFLGTYYIVAFEKKKYLLQNRILWATLKVPSIAHSLHMGSSCQVKIG